MWRMTLLCAAAAVGCGSGPRVGSFGFAGAPPAPAPDGGGAGADGRADGSADAAPAFPAAIVSGTRLRARTRVAADGTRQTDTVDGTPRGQIWWDTMLETPCTFQGSDQDLACVPLTAFGDPPNVFGLVSLAFLDATCQGERLAAGPLSSSAALREASCGARRYASLVPTDRSPDFDLFEVGAPVGAFPVFSQAPNGTDPCAPPGADAPNHYFHLGRKIQRRELVAGHVETISTGHRMSFVSIVAADGARQRIGWHDTALDADCTVGLAPDGQPRCLPGAESLLPLGDWYGDPGCSAPIVILSPGSTATFGKAGDGQDPLRAGAYYRIGAAPKSVFQKSSQGCAPLDQGTMFLRTVTEVVPTTFDAFAQTAVAQTRLQVIVRADPEGAVDPFPLVPVGFPATIFDTTTMEPCVFQPAADGKVRCLPEWNVMRYTSPACAAASASGVALIELLADKRAKHVAAWSGDACTGGLALSQLGQRLGPQIDGVWDTSAYGDFCWQDPVGDPNADLYAVGAAEPASTFVEATLVTE